MTEPRVRLHDVSISGTENPDAVIEAVREAVAGATMKGSNPADTIRSAVAQAASEGTTP